MKRLKYAETRDRTGDLQIFSLTLSQLSYRGLNARAGILSGSSQICLIDLLICHLARQHLLEGSPYFLHDSVAEWSKASDSSSDGAIRVGSNPTAVNFFLAKVTTVYQRAKFQKSHSQNATYRDRTCDLEVNSLTL